MKTSFEFLTKTNFQELKQVLERNGFEGFKTIEKLTNNNDAPFQKGVYMILRDSESEPIFIGCGTGGYYKGKNPNVSISKLSQNWVENSPILYIGETADTLNKRLSDCMCFGQGEPVRHWGGRFIWQLKDAQKLVVCWKILKDKNPKDEKYYLLKAFKDIYKKLPFANCKSGNKPKMTR